MAANLAFTADLAPATAVAPAPAKLAERFGRLFSFVRPKSAESQIGDFIEQNGGVLTDELERQISRKFGHMVG